MSHVRTPLRDLDSVRRTSREVAECITAELIATYTPKLPPPQKGRLIYFLLGLSVGATGMFIAAALLLWRFN